MSDELTYVPTLLKMSGILVPPFSARGLQQTLEPIDAQANLRRNINGALLNLSAQQFEKYKSTITGNDQKPPSCDGVWAGKSVIVDCVAELCTPIGNAPIREVVEGSQYDEFGFTFYRPRLQMMVTGFSIQTNEWQAQVGWTMQLEEV
jgi:hypothetical protein